MKKYYFASGIRGIVGEHSGNIRGAKAKAQKLAEQLDEEITIFVRSNKEIDYSSINTGDGMWNIINDYCYYIDKVCPEATAETVESVEETTVSETETVETEVAEKFIIYVSDDDLNVFCAKVFVGTVKELDDECDRIIAETNCEEYLHVLCYTDKRWEWVQKHYNQVSKSALSVVVRKTETAEQKTELNAEVEAEQTAENKTETTAENITVSGTNQDNINVLIVADIANTFEMITHTGYFDTS